ncbi:MAG: phosphoglycerate mutase family protein [Nitriliruptorales bacterium]|nr:phosphoglycerate mutase family protein [Nitriliruptorales bacterium]
MTRAPATIILLRHALAGRRSDWTGPDHMRPLDEAGERQARAIAATLQGLAPDRLLTSSYVRCIDTLEPFATAVGMDIQLHDALVEGATQADVENMLESLTGRVVLCTHGDVCRRITDWAHRRDLPVPIDTETPKGAIWVIDRAAETANLIPPAVAAAEQV